MSDAGIALIPAELLLQQAVHALHDDDVERAAADMQADIARHGMATSRDHAVLAWVAMVEGDLGSPHCLLCDQRFLACEQAAYFIYMCDGTHHIVKASAATAPPARTPTR